MPMHPRTKKILHQQQLDLDITTINPVGYFDMIELIKNCGLVMTDSGGLQKEAYFFSKQCVTLRDETEWVELVDNNVNTIVGANTQLIIEAVSGTKQKEADFSINLYGDGKASQTIALHLATLI